MDYDQMLGLSPNRVVVVGAGKSGLAVAQFCAGRNAHVIVSDKRPPSELAAARAALPPGLDGAIEWELGGHQAATFAGADLIVLSPGVPPLPELEAARARGVPVTGEIELAARFIKAPVVGVTGTNGKSTTTALAGAMAAATGRPTFVGGNLGTPLITCVDSEAASQRGLVVVELSSYQLETTHKLHPTAAALTNLTPDHLDRYGSLEAYGRAKLRIGQRMGPGEVLAVNAEDPFYVAEVPRALPYATKLWFAGAPRTSGPALAGWLDGEHLVLELPDQPREEFPLAALRLIGRHNAMNALCALLMMRGSQLASHDECRRALGDFRALPHRMQLVGERGGVRFYDDSKATNVDSVVAGVDGFPAPFVLIAGGRDKGGSYAPLRAVVERGRCRRVLTLGEAAPLIEAAFAGSPIACERVATLEAAVARGAALSAPGDAVVLSPACSSFDMFRNYEHRGDVFCAAVEALPA